MATADPAQQRMMMFMPIFMGFMFYRFASGMVLYWLTSSVVQILQQVFINRRMPRASRNLPCRASPLRPRGELWIARRVPLLNIRHRRNI